MYCATCGNAITPGLSYCNRCGASLKERAEPTTRTGAVVAFLIAITVLAIAGLGIMIGGALALKREAALGEDVVGMFMFFTFFILTLTEFFLVRQLSKLIAAPESKKIISQPLLQMPHELPSGQARGLPEPVSSVTENTTRTLEYARKEQPH